MIADRSRSVGSRAVSKQGGASVLVMPSSRGVVRRALADQPGEAAGIENQPDAAVAQDGAAGDAANALEGAAERLDDDFLLADQLVDDERGRPAVVLEHDDRRVGHVALRAGDPEQVA